MAYWMLLTGIFYSMILVSPLQDLREKRDTPEERKSNYNYTEIINFWEKHRHELDLHGQHEEVVLVMGNTGAGKTTLVSALVGRKLKAVESDAYLVIDDEEKKIGTGVESKTLIPEVMRDTERKVTYIDCSGFRDNRNIEYEIASMYFQKILLTQMKKIKLLLVINYESLKKNGNKNDFDDLFLHVGEFVKNISRIHDGVALVATKVENNRRRAKNGTDVLVNYDQKVLLGIEYFLRNKSEAYRHNTKDPRKYRTFVDLIDVLLTKKNDTYRRIALFRQPDGEGLLRDLPETKGQIEAITDMITQNLRYVEAKKDDFGFALSDSLKATVDQIVEDIFRGALTDRLHKMSNETLTYFLQMEKDVSDIELLQQRMLHAHSVVLRIKNTTSPLALFQDFLDAANSLDIPVSLINLKTLTDDIEKLYFFTTVSNKNEDTHMLLLQIEVQKVINSIAESKNFYDFLNNFQKNLATNKSQKLRSDHITRIMNSCTDSRVSTAQNIPHLKEVAKEIDSDEMYERIEATRLNKIKLKHLKAVFSAFTTRIESTCSLSSEQLTVKGYNVRMSDIMQIDCWSKARIIKIFALNRVLIDRTVDRTGTQTQLTIISPTWEIVGGPKIILNGQAGEPRDDEYASASSFNTESGGDGLPGLPGGSAGNFFGVGAEFVNSEQLEILANGGRGGPGQHGGNGADGVPGEGLPKDFFDRERSYGDMIKYWKRHSYMYEERLDRVSPFSFAKFLSYFTVFGKPALKPSDGGDGGAGGLGGQRGAIMINGLGQPMDVKTSSHSGPSGIPGKGGNGGRETSDGRSVKSIYQPLHGDTIYKIEWSDGKKVPAGKNGRPGHNVRGIKLPTTTAMTSRYESINSFKNFVRMNLFNNIRESSLKSFLQKLDSNVAIKAEYTTLAYVRELEGLENQFLELSSKIDLVPFYNSLLTRIEEHAKTDRHPESKKVLNYIYVAALTKVIALKKERKGPTVVDLPKYLDTINTSIKRIREAQHLQLVMRYRDDYKENLDKKIREAEGFILDKLEPEIDKLSDQTDHQIKAILNEINENRNLTKEALTSLEKKKIKVRNLLELRAGLWPLELAGIALSFLGPIGVGVGVSVIGATSIAEGMVPDTYLRQKKLYSLDPNFKFLTRVTNVLNNKKHLETIKLNKAIEIVDKYNKELLNLSDKGKVQTRRLLTVLRTQYLKVQNRRSCWHSGELQRLADLKKIEDELSEFVRLEKKILNKLAESEKNVETLEKEVLYKSRRRLLNDLQSILNGAEMYFDFIKNKQNDEAIIDIINKQMSERAQQLRDLGEIEGQVYEIILPDFRTIESTINAVENLINGSSHSQLDVTKWTVRSSLRDLKSLLQKFTGKMSFELRNNLERYVEKMEEGFSILIDIYDRIDSYSDSVEQAEYVANIASAPMTDVHVTDVKLTNAIVDLEQIIHSNILLQKYSIAVHAFKQHFYPFAADVFQQFQLPSDLRLNDTESLRSNIIRRIEDMKNHISESEATMDKYSPYIHERIIFNSNTSGSSPFYVWRHDAIKNDIHRLFNGSEILLKADVSKGLPYNSIKYNDIGINFKMKNVVLQKNLTSSLMNFRLTMTMIGNNYYRCGERYHSIPFDDDITISYILQQDKNDNWLDSNKVYTMIRNSHTFLSPYGLWSIKLTSINESVSFDHLKPYASETIDMELFGQGHYIEQNTNIDFEVCNQYLDTFYDIETIPKVLV